jgi:hypothetical protein
VPAAGVGQRLRAHLAPLGRAARAPRLLLWRRLRSPRSGRAGTAGLQGLLRSLRAEFPARKTAMIV